ncbi:ISL3 family transposase [Candidatus Woesearchaeota archaeon]|nr:ISL3 family transposase [Candidatus Woesearchaeota archaeon]
MIRRLNADLTELLDLPDFIVDDYEIQRGIVFIHAHPKDDTQICPKCGSRKVKLKESLPKRVIRDRDIFGKKCYIIIHPRRFRCLKCKKRFSERFNSIEPKKTYTKRYAEWVHKLCLKIDIKFVSSLEEIGYKKAEGIFYNISKKKLSMDKDLEFDKIGLDEISLKKGHKDFITIISDLTNSRPIAVLKDRKKETLDQFFKNMDEKTKNKINEASIDMWGPYFDVIKKHFPNAKVVVDRFHVQKHLNKVLTSVRRKIQNLLDKEEKKVIKGSRWVLVKNMNDLNEKEKTKLDEIYNKCSLLKKYHQAKEKFRYIFETIETKEKAKVKIDEWINYIHKNNLYHFSKFIETLEHWKEQIINYFISKTTNGFVEGLNNKIKLLKRIGFGFTNIEHFGIRILQI